MHETVEIVHKPVIPVHETAPALQFPAPDERLVALWLHGRPALTVEAYRRDITRMLRFVDKPVAAITLADLQEYADELEVERLAVRSRMRMLSTVKSLLRFLARAGLIPVDVGVALRLPKQDWSPTERILSRAEVRRLIRSGRTPREIAMLSLLYEGGFRRAEIAGMRWSNASAAEDDTGDVILSFVGKRLKRRYVRITAKTWALAAALRRPEDPEDALLFAGITFSELRTVVTAAARRAKIAKRVSPHWLRHAHASHALEAGAPISLVRDTLGHASIATTGIYAHGRPNSSSGKYLRL